MNPNVNLEQQYQQAQQPYNNQGIPMNNQQYGGYQYNGYQYNTGMISTQKRTSDKLAVASLVLGIISIVGACCLGGFLGIIGAILGIIAITDNLCRKKSSCNNRHYIICISTFSLNYYSICRRSTCYYAQCNKFKIL